MDPQVWSAAAHRIGEHVRRHGVRQVRIVLHGGEPLLAGTDRLVGIATAIRAALPPDVRSGVSLQTNGVLLTPPVLRRLLDHRIRVGVSVDGVAGDHDKRRRYADGRGSWSQVARSVRLLTSPAFRPIFAGLLCTIDPDTDPVVVYEALLAYAPPTVDVLFPHANWSDPGNQHGYGDWLARLFDRWYDAPRKETSIRFFEELIHLVFGGASRTEQIGLSPAAVAIVETDGAIEQSDALKSAYPGAAGTGLSVLSDSFDAALEHPGFIARQLGTAALAHACTACPVHQVCGGGHYAHRYRPGSGFRNPSVYCPDLMTIIRHVSHRLAASVAAAVAEVPA
jgi:uncharacterized protein